MTRSAVCCPCACLRRVAGWQGMLRKPEDEDIRASILRHAGKEDDQFNTFTRAYAQTQPQRIFAEEEEEEEEGGKGGS